MENLKKSFKNIKSIFRTKITDENFRIFVNLYLTNNKSKLPSNLKNKPIGKWNVKHVTDMSNLFDDDEKFNDPLNEWNVSNVTNMKNMFKGAITFNQDISQWNISKVTDMTSMFEGCRSLNKSFLFWNPSPGTKIENMFKNSGVTELPNFYIRYLETLQPSQSAINPEVIRRENIQRALHVHETFKKLNLIELMKIIKPIVNKEDTVYSKVEWQYFMFNIKSKMKNYISNNFEKNKTSFISSLNSVIKKVSKESEFATDEMKIYIGNTIDYLFMQPKTIITNYIHIFVEECQTAYGKQLNINSNDMKTENISCIKGIVERFFLTLINTLLMHCITDIKECSNEYKKILFKGFNVNVKKLTKLDKNELTKQWNDEFLENESFLKKNNLNENNSKRLSDNDRETFLKNHYIDFMKSKYQEEEIYTRDIKDMIMLEANNLESAGVFKNMYFGGKGRKYKKTNKRYIMNKNKRATSKIM